MSNALPSRTLPTERRAPTADTDPELLGLGVVVTVLERVTEPERQRLLAYLNDRYGTPDSGPGERTTPGPATGLRTERRTSPDHRNVNARGIGFRQINA